LVVDDEPGVRELIADFFIRQGIPTTVAADGREAIAILEKGATDFGLIVTDVNLPGADGFQVLDTARRLSPLTFVVIVTGYASLDSAIRAVRMGAYDYLPKPFSLGQLDLILRRIRDLAALTGRSQAERPLRAVEPAIVPAPAPRPRLVTPAQGDPVEQRLNNIETLLRSIDSTLGVIAAHLQDGSMTPGRR